MWHRIVNIVHVAAASPQWSLLQAAEWFVKRLYISAPKHPNGRPGKLCLAMWVHILLKLRTVSIVWNGRGESKRIFCGKSTIVWNSGFQVHKQKLPGAPSPLVMHVAAHGGSPKNGCEPNGSRSLECLLSGPLWQSCAGP